MNKRRLKNFDFKGENAAVALVSKDQGGAANGYETLIIKSNDPDVAVTMTFGDFLYRFYGLWSGDADLVSRIAGMNGTTEALWNEEEFEKNIYMLKSAKDDFSKVDVEVVKQLASLFNVEIEDSNMTVENTTQVDEISEIQKTLTEKEKVIKSLQEKLEAAEAAEIQKAKESFVSKAADMKLVEEADVQSFGEALYEMSKVESFGVVTKALENATKLTKAAVESVSEPTGHDVDVPVVSGLEAVLKATGNIK